MSIVVIVQVYLSLFELKFDVANDEFIRYSDFFMDLFWKISTVLMVRRKVLLRVFLKAFGKIDLVKVLSDKFWE